jgi:hypothetical protein
MDLRMIVNPMFLRGFEELAKNDVIFQKVIEKSYDEKSLINSLISGIFCLLDRHNRQLTIINDIIQANPEFKKIIERRNDTSFLLRTGDGSGTDPG